MDQRFRYVKGGEFIVYFGPSGSVFFDSKVLTCNTWDKIKRAFKK